MTASASAVRRRVPLAARTRTRLLHALLARADEGDISASEALVRLSLAAESLGPGGIVAIVVSAAGAVSSALGR